MFESLKKTKIEPKKLTIGDITDVGIVVNYTKLNQKIKECKLDKENKICKEQLKNLGISWIDE